MLQPVYEKPLKTIDELFQSNLKFERKYFNTFFNKENQDHQKIIQDDRIIDVDLSPYDEVWTAQIIENKIALNQPCDHFKNTINEFGDGKSYLGIYQIPEVAYIYPENLYVAPFHPFLDNFQNLMDLSFEAGLPSAWKRFYFEFIRNFYSDLKTKEKLGDKITLDFVDIGPFFLILIFGYMAAVLVILMEIFYHDFIVKLEIKFSIWKFLKIFKRKIFVRKIKVRRFEEIS